VEFRIFAYSDRMQPCYRQRCGAGCALLIGAALFGSPGIVFATPPQPAPGSQSALHAEVARGAATVGEITAKKLPYDTAHRLIRAALEKNVQVRRDSDAFRLGAHLAAAFWVEQLPTDVTWRDTARARHGDLVVWLTARVGLPPEEVAQTVVQAEGLPPDAKRRLLQLLRGTEQ
jgi:hypothetical protein